MYYNPIQAGVFWNHTGWGCMIKIFSGGKGGGWEGGSSEGCLNWGGGGS